MNYNGDLRSTDSLEFPGISRIRSRKEPMLVLLANVMRGSRSVVLQGNLFEKEMVLSFKFASPFPFETSRLLQALTRLDQYSARIAQRTHAKTRRSTHTLDKAQMYGAE
jgi:hypothetical protein